MIIQETTGNLFESTCQTLTVTTNTVGVMGKGIALEAKQRYPEVEREYRAACRSGEHDIGKPGLFPIADDRWLLLFPTKRHWRQPSQLEWIEWGLQALIENSLYPPFNQITSLAMAPLGCGNGGLDYDSAVRPLLYHYLDPWWIPVTLYRP